MKRIKVMTAEGWKSVVCFCEFSHLIGSIEMRFAITLPVITGNRVGDVNLVVTHVETGYRFTDMTFKQLALVSKGRMVNAYRLSGLLAINEKVKEVGVGRIEKAIKKVTG